MLKYKIWKIKRNLKEISVTIIEPAMFDKHNGFIRALGKFM